LPPEATGKTIEIWFQDEARVGQQGTLSYQWALRGSRPPAVRDNRHDSASIFGAICPARAVAAAIVTPWVNSEAMTIHLAEIGKQISPRAHAVLVCDGAGWHQTGRRLSVPDNVTLLRLPPYSPELNPIENVWEYLRGNKLSRGVWQSYDDIVQACCDAWNWLIADTVRVASITTRKWASVST
jgi:transposase